MLSQLEGLTVEEFRNPSLEVRKLAFSLCRNDRQGELTELLGAGYDCNATLPLGVDKSGNRLLHIAATNSSASLTSKILEAGGDIDAPNVLGNTALHLALYYKKIQVSDLLLKAGANETVLNLEGLTPWEGLRRDELDEL